MRTKKGTNSQEHKQRHTETQGEPKSNIRNSSQTNLKTANVTKKNWFKNKITNDPYSNIVYFYMLKPSNTY